MKAADTATMRALTTSTNELLRDGDWEGSGAVLIRQPANIAATGVLTPGGRERMAQLLEGSGPPFDVEIDAIRTDGSGRAYARTCGHWYACAALLWAGTRRAVAIESAAGPGLLFLGGPQRQPSMMVAATRFTDEQLGYSDLDKLRALRAGGGS